MTKLLIATHNMAKYQRYRTILEHNRNVILLSLRDVCISEKIAETGTTAAENAPQKAQGYALLAGLPTLSVDEAMFVEGFAPEEQPGVHVRRYGGREATDDELFAMFLAKVKKPRSRTTARSLDLCSLPGSSWGENMDEAGLCPYSFYRSTAFSLIAWVSTSVFTSRSSPGEKSLRLHPRGETFAPG